jgi:4-amino-4-deoxy-L-arabinose transferase-like glycosyltransferase
VPVQPHADPEPQDRPEESPPAEAGPGEPADRSWLRRAALIVIAALAGLSYAWSASQDTVEFYYAAAVRSMSENWHDFIFGAFDPAGTISLDKLPGAFWIQALAVHAFGFHTWAIILPQVVEGVLTVLVLYRAVSRLAGQGAGLIAALVIAVSPATVALNRGNISDSLMILLLVLAADSVSAAIVARGRGWRGAQARLILAAFWVGLAFQAKMIEAWLVLPALGLAYLLEGPGTLTRRVRHVVVAGVVVGIVSLAWMTAVSLVPAAHRPYADGSSRDSLYAQVFVYNGFGRFGDQTPVQLLASQLAPDQTIPVAPANADRLFTGNLGRDTGWLLPVAVPGALWGIASRRRRPRGDSLRACFVLWGAWLLILGVTFSAATYVQTYYTAALTPAIAAILATAAVSVLVPGNPANAGNPSDAGNPADAGLTTRRSSRDVVRRIGLAVVSAGTTAYAVWLVPAQGAHVPGWLVPAIVAVGGAAVIVVIGSALIKRAALAAAAMAAVLAAALWAPAVASVGLAANHESAFDTPFEPTRLATLIASVPARLAQLQRVTIPRLELLQAGAPDLLAVQSSYIASLFIDTSGREALPIGGFTGTIPSPTLSQLQADIREGQFHLVLALSATTDPRIKWIAAHCRGLGTTDYCVRSDAS